MEIVMKGSVLGAFLFCIAAVNAYNQCDIPPRFWCDDRETAIKCGVVEQCSQHEWAVADDKVDFALYYESLCPDCRAFITGNLFPNYANLSSIMNLTIVPYGNARETKDGDRWKFDCQHGRLECIGNLIDTCAIHFVKDINKYFPFINCMESSEEDPTPAAKKCAKKFPVPLDDILKCSKSDLGNQLEHEMAVRTNALNPPHQYVPWVTLNGVHTEKIQNEATKNLVKLICETYKGAKKPPVCN